jgi:hypothetical protein
LLLTIACKSFPGARTTPVQDPPLAITVGVAAELTLALLAALLAVTVTRRVVPTSALWTVYDAEVAPPIDEQFPPDESQRPHWYA